MLRMDGRATVSPAGNAEENFRRALGSRLTQLRRTKGWTQRELARRAQVDPGRLSKLERGVHRTSLDELVRLSLALNAGLDELVFGASTLEDSWRRLLRELEESGGAPALDCATRLLRALVHELHEKGRS
ncbi:MAG TPA: helix-turn-helix domain-containing protein [Thermoanaerobaculia bacterium]|jgi:transcriptional regulator with XRE-family HTH domain|nr:helix-turn-helix domain-containing protein [Thermoanaerobaculia bacterium]